VTDEEREAKQWEELATKMANDALPYRVTGREWETAMRVARKVLDWVDRARMIPMNDAVEVCMAQLGRLGFTVIRKESMDELVQAMDAFGMDKQYATDSIKLSRVKVALYAFRNGGRLL